MAAQVARGQRVAYFFPGRHYPLLRTPRLRRWKRGGVAMYEWLNSPIVVGVHRGTPNPEADLSHPGAEATFAEVLEQVGPDIVHVHDLGGLPSSLVDVVRAAGRPAVMTLLDYHPLCPTIKLFDVDAAICLRTEPGAQCARCCAHAPLDNYELRERTLAFEANRARRSVPGVDAVLSHRGVQRAVLAVGQRIAAMNAGEPPGEEEAAPTSSSPAAYQRRRDVNVERLNSFDLLLPMSGRSAEIYAMLGVEPARLRPIELTLRHLENLRPGRVAGTSPPLTFAVLNAMPSPQKGSQLVVAALRLLRDAGLGGCYRLRVAGWTPADVEGQLREHPEVELTGPYGSDDLDRILTGVDVGLIPSIWEEVYGFIGPEFLAKGIPVIGNALGGIPEYVRDGETGWLNTASSAAGLAGWMENAIRHPEQVAALSERVIARRHELIKPLARHVEEIDAIYRELLARRERLAAGS